MKIDCNQSLRLGLFQTTSGLARLLQVFWMFPLALRAFVQRGFLLRRHSLFTLFFGVAVLSALASGVANGQESRGAVDLGPHAEGKFAPAPANARAQAQRRLPQSRLPAQVVLDRVEAARLSIEAAVQPSKPGVPLKIGFSRDVPMLRTTSQTSALMVWTGVPGGQIAAISITSPDALGVRLGLLVEKLPATALLRFYAQGADQVFEVSGQEIMKTIARNLAAGDKSDEARTYWSPVIDGQEITVEVELPAGVSPDEVRFSIPRVSHLFSSPLDTRALQEKIGQAASCNLDSMCYQSTWGNESLATAKMAFMSGGSSYVCTGTLMNDGDPSTYIPFFLTADHCIPTQTEASTLQTYWFYRASSCNSGILSSSTQTLTGGATLLYASSNTDTSFMRLNSAPPAGALYSGWTANLPALNTPGTAIHNPKGDLQKISFGTITDYENCIPGGSGTFSCSSASSGSADHLAVVWSQGIAEPGSSGSGLWVASGSSHYLVGQLNGGSSSCFSSTGSDSYGSFGVAYNAALYQWLGNTVALPEDGFPPGGSLPAGWVQPAGSNAPWVVANDLVYAGAFSLKSGLIGNSQRSDISSTANFSAGTVSFARKVSSESGYDFLKFYIDGVLQNSWSGEVAWSIVSFPLAAGTHTLLWSYIKDQFVAGGSDAAWIDSVTLPTAPPMYLLSIAKSGTGTGTISSSPAGISCGATCSASYSSGTNVTLSATADVGSTFTRWSGGGCSGTGTCTVSMTQTQSVIATFTSGSGSGASYTLSVTELGTGSGTVISLPAGINCGTACSLIYPSGTSVTLGAKVDVGSTFTGWSGGGCSGTFLCTVSMTQAQSVTATFFSSSGYTLSVAKSGTGSGTVVSSRAGINCGTVCSAGYPGGTSVTLTATVDVGSNFTGWSGACSGMDACTVSMSQAHSVTATFTLVSASSASPYDGIYQWDTGYFLSVHQIGGGAVIASIYWVYDANTEQVGTRAIPAADTFDLLQGQIVGSTATITGTRFYRACTLSYDLTFNSDASLTVRLNSVSNSPGVSVADVDCAARYNSVGSLWTVPKIY